jgi:hypothetical protein
MRQLGSAIAMGLLGMIVAGCDPTHGVYIQNETDRDLGVDIGRVEWGEQRCTFGIFCGWSSEGPTEPDAAYVVPARVTAGFWDGIGDIQFAGLVVVWDSSTCARMGELSFDPMGNVLIHITDQGISAGTPDFSELSVTYDSPVDHVFDRFSCP